MPNGKPGDNPLSDMVIHGKHPFPADIEQTMWRIQHLGAQEGRYPLGENWPFSPREFDWEKGKNLEEGRRLLGSLLEALEAGTGDEILVDPLTQRPFRNSRG